MNRDEPLSPPQSPGPPDELLARALQTPGPTGGMGSWAPPDPEEMSRLLPQYEIVKLLGHGGMGAVYQGRQASLDRAVAIKLLPAEFATNPDFVARFRREAQTLARLAHPGIVAVHDFGQTSEGHLYFVMEFVDGTDLHRVIREGVTAEQALALTVQICEALQFAHSQGVIHRDIKPANILITRDGRVKLADFGLARPWQEEVARVTQTSMIMGTPDYMAPEQREGHGDHRADIFALGVVLYEMLTGQRPQGIFDPPSRKVQVDVRVDEVVIRALQQEPERRYQAASEMGTDVERIRTGPAPRVAPQVRPPSLARIRRAALVVLAAALAAGAWWMRERPNAHTVDAPAPRQFDVAARDLCFLRDEWNKGIPLLAVNGGPFQEAASAEAQAGGASARAEAARRWIAAGSRVESPDRWHCYRRARALFHEVLKDVELQREPGRWNAVRAELERVPTLQARLQLNGRSYFRERLQLRQSSATWSSFECNGGYVNLVGLQTLPQFSHNGGGTKSRAISLEELRTLLPEGLDFSTARIESARFGATTGSAARVLDSQVTPDGTGFEVHFGELNAAKVRYPGNFTFYLTIAIGGDRVNVPTPMPAPAKPQLSAPTVSTAPPAPATPFPVVWAPREPATPAPLVSQPTPMPFPTPAPAPTVTRLPVATPAPGTPVAIARMPAPTPPARPLATPVAVERPPLGVPQDAKPCNGKWYRVYNDRMSWKNARERCVQLGGRLAVIHDQPTNAFVLKLADGRQFWLGASEERAKGEWTWIDGKPMSFTAWVKGEPNVERVRACLCTWRGGWGDDSEQVQYGYICEWRGR